MKMSTEYLEETVGWLVAAGYRLQQEQDTAMKGDQPLFERTRWILEADDSCLILEALCYPDGQTRWFLAIPRFHGLSSTSYPLDSWKHRPDRVEFKYQIDPSTGTALSFVLRP